MYWWLIWCASFSKFVLSKGKAQDFLHEPPYKSNSSNSVYEFLCICVSHICGGCGLRWSVFLRYSSLYLWRQDCSLTLELISLPVSSRDPLVVLLGFGHLFLCPAITWTLRIQNSLPYACTAHTSLAAASQVLSHNSSPRKLRVSGIGWSFLLILPVQYSISDIQSGRQKTQS